LHKRWWLDSEDRHQIELLAEAHVLLVILVRTCHEEAAEQGWRRVALLL
jgi:hypothetical protein